MVALESAVDELSYALDMDPLALHLVNYAETGPVNGKPFSSNHLRDAYAEGARARAPSPRRLPPNASHRG